MANNHTNTICGDFPQHIVLQSWQHLPAIMLFLVFHSLLSLLASTAVGAATDYTSEAETALTALQSWYDESTGLYDTAGWWNNANALTMIGNLALVAPSTKAEVSRVFNNSLVAVANFNQKLGWGTGFNNFYYDDEGWWALAWIQAYDVTNDTQYLTAAANIFENLKNGTNGPCSDGTSGIFWNKNDTYVNAITNELYLGAAASLANRMSNKQYYLDIALKQWAWFQKTGLINSQNLINDGLQNDNCANNGEPELTYNQGVILGALVELNQAQNNESFLTTAKNIAKAAISKFSDSNNILRDGCEPNCGVDEVQFKGVLIRNLQKLQSAAPDPVFLDSISANAGSIWSNDRNNQSQLGITWAGPFVTPANAATHSCAMDALVAAVTFQEDLNHRH